jgi:hypothetical protein
MKEKGKKFLDPKDPKVERLAAIIGEIVARRGEFVHGYRTTNAESAHMMRVWWTVKNVVYWKFFEGRTHFSILWGYYSWGAIELVMAELGVHTHAQKHTHTNTQTKTLTHTQVPLNAEALARLRSKQAKHLARRARHMTAECRKRRGVQKGVQRGRGKEEKKASKEFRDKTDAGGYKTAAEKRVPEFGVGVRRGGGGGGGGGGGAGAKTKTRIPCPVCHNLLAKSSLKKHMRTQHRPTGSASEQVGESEPTLGQIMQYNMANMATDLEDIPKL